MKQPKTIIFAIILALVLVSSACYFPQFISTEDAIATSVADALQKYADQTATVEAIATYTPYPTYTPNPTYTPQPSSAWYPYLYDYHPSDSGVRVGYYCNHASFVSETIADNTIFNAGESFTKSWTLMNTGQCTWSSGYRLVFREGSTMGGVLSSALPHDVPPGGTVTLSVILASPSSFGTYRGDWGLQTADGYRFALFWVQIHVR